MQEIDFIENSNWIEGEYSPEALDDAVEAWEYLKRQKSLTNKKILKVHEILMKRLRPDIAGRFRDCAVTIGGVLKPKPKSLCRMSREMDVWRSTYRYFKEKADITEKNLRHSHIDFETMHPFEDGNGRVGRILYNWQRLDAGFPIEVILESEKADYYKWFE